MAVPNVSEAGFKLCPAGKHLFKISVFKEEDEYVTLQCESQQGNVFHRFPTDADDDFAWLLKEFLVKLGMPTEGGYPWTDLNGRFVYAWIIHKEHKGKTYANVNGWESYIPPKQSPNTTDDGMPF